MAIKYINVKLGKIKYAFPSTNKVRKVVYFDKVQNIMIFILVWVFIILCIRFVNIE